MNILQIRRRTMYVMCWKTCKPADTSAELVFLFSITWKFMRQNATCAWHVMHPLAYRMTWHVIWKAVVWRTVAYVSLLSKLLLMSTESKLLKALLVRNILREYSALCVLACRNFLRWRQKLDLFLCDYISRISGRNCQRNDLVCDYHGQFVVIPWLCLFTYMLTVVHCFVIYFYESQRVLHVAGAFHNSYVGHILPPYSDDLWNLDWPLGVEHLKVSSFTDIIGHCQPQPVMAMLMPK